MKKFNLNCILLVDDDDITNLYNEYMLKNAALAESIQIVLNGQEALDYLLNKGKFEKNGTEYPQPDLILLDINMPIMNGFEFLDEYEKLPENVKGKIVICMLTTSLHEKDMKRANSNIAVSEFINKPLDISVLEGIITKHLK